MVMETEVVASIAVMRPLIVRARRRLAVDLRIERWPDARAGDSNQLNATTTSTTDANHRRALDEATPEP